MYAKYIVAIIILFISVTVSCFTMGMKNGINLFEFIETTLLASISFILVYLSFVLPISFWLGYKNYSYYNSNIHGADCYFRNFVSNQLGTNSII